MKGEKEFLELKPDAKSMDVFRLCRYWTCDTYEQYHTSACDLAAVLFVPLTKLSEWTSLHEVCEMVLGQDFTRWYWPLAEKIIPYLAKRLGWQEQWLQVEAWSQAGQGGRAVPHYKST